MSDWTQPCCDSCWTVRHGDRTPPRVILSDSLQCCFCGTETTSGIFIRIDPATVTHPTRGRYE